MKLWQKNFLIVSALFSTVIYTCVFSLVAPSVTSLLNNTRASAISEEYALSRAMDATLHELDTDSHENAVSAFARYYEKNGVFLEVGDETDMLFSNIPFTYDSPGGTVSWVRRDNGTYIHITDELSSGYAFVYIKSVGDVIGTGIRQSITAVLLGTGAILLLCLFLYYTLKKINEPMDRLAHELRTPLTAISGFAEALMISKLSEEQRHLAASYILDESRRLGAISEKLLTMSDLRESPINKDSVDWEDLFLHVQKTYGRVRYTVEWKSVTGDRVLLESLVGNLVANALHASLEDGIAELIAKDHQIIVRDHGKGMNEEQLHYVNNPARKVNPSKRSGLGVPLCHEIVRLHGAVLRFSSSPGDGTQAVITFYNSITS